MPPPAKRSKIGTINVRKRLYRPIRCFGTENTEDFVANEEVNKSNETNHCDCRGSCQENPIDLCGGCNIEDSSEIHKKKPGGLDVTNLNLSDGGAYWRKEGVEPMTSSTFQGADGKWYHQSMQREDRVQKGLKTILQERGIWNDAWSKECKDGCMDGRTDCCAKTALASQPDFMNQKEWLTEVVVSFGHKIIFYPKFHCELNFIENVWAYIKNKLRCICTYKYNDLKVKLPDVIKQVPIDYIQKMCSHSFKFMELYRMGLKGPLLDYVMRKYRGHRTIPAFVNNELATLELEFNKKVGITR
jgi:hypothetical protein